MAQKKLESYIDEIILGKEEKESSFNELDKAKYGVTFNEIKKLQIICNDGEAEDYFRKLVEFYEEVKDKNVSGEVKDICYIELGKKMIKKVQKSPVYQPSFNNLYIRGELMPNILEHVKEKAKISKNSIFILPNQNGINFSTNKCPEMLKSLLETKKYTEIIKQVNYIIQDEIYKEKYGKTPEKDFWLRSLIILMIVTMFIIILNIIKLSEETLIITSFFLVLTFLLILSISLQTFRCEMKNAGIVIKIYQEIKKYFKFLNGVSSNNLEWTIGEYFFWIQIKVHKDEGNHRSQLSNSQIISYNGKYLIDKIKQS